MLADLGIAAAGSVASPRTYTPATAIDSVVCQLTPHQRLLAVISLAWRAISAAPWGGTTLSTSPLNESNSVLTVIALTSTSFASWFGRYSMMPLYNSFHAARKRPFFETMSSLASSRITFDFGFAVLK